MKFILRIFQILYNIYAALWFIALMLIVIPFVFICSFFGKVRGGNLIYKLCNIWARIWYALIGIRHREIYEKKPNRQQAYVFIANHISYMDIPAIIRGIHQPIRILAKAEMASIPLFGFIYKKAAVLVNRKSAEDRQKSIQQLKEALQKNISIVIYPEGTFNKTGKPLKDFYNGAFSIAIETQTPLLPVLLLDTQQRMNHNGILTLTPGKSRMVYLSEISVQNYSVHQVEELKNKAHYIMETALRKYGSF